MTSEMMEILSVRVVLAVSLLLILVAAASANAYEPYRIQSNSPVHVTGAGNEVILLYGDAPDARWVEIVVAGIMYESGVRDGSFYLTIPAPVPGIYNVTGVWGAETTGTSGATQETTQETTGYLVGGIITVLGRGYGDVPAGTATVLPGAHMEECGECVAYATDMVEAGGYVLVTNSDTERHQFVTDEWWAVQSTGNLDPGESVRLPFNSEGGATYRCVYHPWLVFPVQSTGMYVADGGPDTIHLETPPYAGDSVRVGITHTGGAAVAHVIFIQHGQVVEAGTVHLAGGYGVYTADSSEWRVGEVIVSVSAGVDHATDTMSVRPPPGAAERAGRITGYDGPDGILINGGLARPAGIIPLDAASEATRQVCMVGRDALFRGDAGLAGGSHYLEGTVWCDGVNLGVYLLASGLAITDPAECGVAQSQWLIHYCYPRQESAPDDMVEQTDDMAEQTDDTFGLQPDDTMLDDTETAPDTAPYDTTGLDDTTEDTPMFDVPPDVPAIPDAGGPEFEMVDTCDHITDPACPCPEGWVRNGDWCDPDWYGGMDAAADAVDSAGEAIDGAISEPLEAGVEDVREGVVDALGGFFAWLGELLMNIPNFFMEMGRWVADQIQ